MTSVPQAVAAAGAVLWWAPALAVMAIRAAPHFIALRGRPFRIRRVHRLLDRGRVDEVDRVIAALHRELDAWERWSGTARQ